MELFESHAHLCDSAFDSDRDEVVADVFSAGVTKIIEIGCFPSDWDNVIGLSGKYPDKIFCALGLHPHGCDLFNPSTEAKLKKIFGEHKITALGEIGLDYARTKHPKDMQKEVFSRLLKIADELRRPVIFHCRNGSNPEKEANAYSDLLEIIGADWKGFKNSRFSGVLHCFSGTQKDAFRALDMGLALGINGTITYPKNNELRDIAKKAGLEKIVLETDCPYLPPQSIRGKRNDPSRLPEIACALAQALGVRVESVAEITFKNCSDLFFNTFDSA